MVSKMAHIVPFFLCQKENVCHVLGILHNYKIKNVGIQVFDWHFLIKKQKQPVELKCHRMALYNEGTERLERRQKSGF